MRCSMKQRKGKKRKPTAQGKSTMFRLLPGIFDLVELPIAGGRVAFAKVAT